MIRYEIKNYELNKEQYLAALLSVKQVTEWQKKQIAKIVENINSEMFQRETIEHRVYGLVLKNIQRYNLFNEESIVHIKKRVNQQIFDTMILSRELVKVNQKFSEKGIRFMLMKGPVLGSRLYKDVTLRTSRDLDILVSLDDIDKAAEALNELGYKTGYTNKYTQKQLKYIYQQGHHFDFRNSEGKEIELHWKVSEMMDTVLEDLWENRREILFAGSNIAIPSAMEEMMFLIHHGICHGFHRMKWLIDIVELIKQEGIVWSQFINYAYKTKRLNELFVGVILCYVIGAFDMPQILLGEIKIYNRDNHVVIEISDEEKKEIVKSIESAIKLMKAMQPIVCYKNGNRDYVVDSREYIKYYHLYVREMNRFQGKKRVKLLWERLQPGERDFNMIHLRDPYFGLYYIVRPIYWVSLRVKSWKHNK